MSGTSQPCSSRFPCNTSQPCWAITAPSEPNPTRLACARYRKYSTTPATAKHAGVASRRQSNPDPVSAPGCDGVLTDGKSPDCDMDDSPVPGGLLSGKRVFPVKDRFS